MTEDDPIELGWMQDFPPQPGLEGDSIADFLPTVAKEDEHGRAFAYREPNIFVLGWPVRRAAQRDLATLASEMIWQHIGVEHDYWYMVDITGAETAAATLRDFTRFGQLIVDGGRVGDQRIVSPAAIDSILGGGNRETFAAGDYDSLPG